MTLVPLSTEQRQLFDDEVQQFGVDLEVEVENLKKWIREQPHLPKYLDNDNKLKNFLFGCKFSIARTKQTIDTYYSVRGAVPEFFKHRDPLHFSVRQAFQISYVCPLPHTTKEGYRVVMVGNLCSDNSKTVAEDFYKILIMIGEIILMEDTCRGLVFVINAQGCTLQQLMKTTIPIIKKFMFCVQKGYPNRIKRIITLNAPGYFQYFVNLFKPTLSKKLQERYTVYSKEQGFEPLYRGIGKEICPQDFGGEGPSLKELMESWRQKLLSYREWFVQEETRLTNESLRPKNIVFNPEEVFGMAGSFRKLVID